MKKTALWILGILGFMIFAVAAAGIYKFNFTDDDVFVDTSVGEIMRYGEELKKADSSTKCNTV